MASSQVNTGRLRDLVVGVCLVSILSAALGIGLRTPVSAGEQHRDAAAYSAMFRVDLNEANRRLALQAQAGALEVQLERGEPETYAGLWIEHQPFRIVAAFTRFDPAVLDRYVRAGPLAGVVVGKSAQYALATLRSDINRLADAPDGPFSAGINVVENAIEIETTSLAAFAEWAAANGVSIPPTVRQKVVSELPRPVSDIYGGLPLDGSGCTSGFSVVDGSGTRGITTAGHCGNSNSYQGYDLPFVSEALGGWYDVQWHTAWPHTVRNWIFDFRQITSRWFWGYQTVGGMVCKYGRTTGYGCGTISQKDHIPPCIPNARPVWVLATGFGAAGGDSGGPVFLSESAYGTIACGNSTTVIYGAIDWLESGLGVTILTAP